jgi:hypothetical protein
MEMDPSKCWSLDRTGYFIASVNNITVFYVLPPQRIYVFCVDLRTNRKYFPIHHSLISSHNTDKNLLHGTNRIFKYNSIPLV